VTGPESRAVSRLLLVGAASLVVVIAASAWLSDDAYITLRVVDNLWHGYGLRWNVLERVQVFTHPLWMLLLAAAYGVTREAYWTTLAVSLTASAATILLLTRRIAAGAAAAVAALGLLAGSKAFVEFSTSGLENPLSHLLLVGVLLASWGGRDRVASLPAAALLLGLCGLCRIDLLILSGPVVVAAAWAERGRLGRLAGLRMGALAVGPLFVWLVFAYVYYGAPWPNTALAKLPVNVGLGERVPQGLRYLLDALANDPVTALTLLAALALAWWSRRDRGLAVAVSASLAYVVAVGGDFMSGRFLSAPFVVAVAYLARAVPWNQRRALGAAAAAVAIAMAMPHTPLRIWQQPRAGAAIVEHQAGIVDERSVYAGYTGVIAAWRGSRPDAHAWARRGREMSSVPQVTVAEAVGFMGYHAGPGVHIVDPLALTDPLLARLPAEHPWRIGHFRRPLPAGYLAFLSACVARAFPGHAVVPPTTTCLDGPTALAGLDPSIARDYQRIALATQRPILDGPRLALLARGGLAW
jgi:arabinofuranosyltransferase